MYKKLSLLRGFSRLVCIAVILSVSYACSEEEHEHDEIINDQSQFYINYNPDINHAGYGSFAYDINYDLTDDINFVISENGIDVIALSDSVMISVGNFTGSGTSNLDMISMNSEINENLEWYHSFLIAGNFQGTNYNGLIEYIGLKLIKNNSPYYGWIYLKTNFPETPELIVKSLYFRQMNDLTVKAGVYNY